MFLVDFEQHDIDIMFIRLHFTNSPLLHAHKTHTKGVSNMLFIKKQHKIHIFGKNGHFTVTLVLPLCCFDPVSLRKRLFNNSTK